MSSYTSLETLNCCCWCSRSIGISKVVVVVVINVIFGDVVDVILGVSWCGRAADDRRSLELF